MKLLMALGSIILTMAMPQMVAAQTTKFSYQGQLTDSGTPQATYQMRFRLFDVLSSGSQIGSTVENSSVAVSGGIFTVSLDFGANVFSGADRFLEIAVRRNGGEGYTVLSPRQQIASSPYAIRTLSAQTADLALNAEKLGGVDASEYVTSANVGGSFINNGTTLQDADFNIDGSAFIGGNVGIGTTTPSVQLDILGASRAFNAGSAHFIAQTTGGTNTWARFYMRSPNRSWFMGTSQNFNGDQFYLVDETGAQARMTIQPNGGAITFPLGNFGIGTTSPNAKLQVAGHASQDRAMGGFVKALVYLNGDGTIARCYNGVTGSSSGNCGFFAGRGTQSTGYYWVDFGFQVSDRFYLASPSIIPETQYPVAVTSTTTPNPTQLFFNVFAFNSLPADAPITIAVF
jgi:hypothetical protein